MFCLSRYKVCFRKKGQQNHIEQFHEILVSITNSDSNEDDDGVEDPEKEDDGVEDPEKDDDGGDDPEEDDDESEQSQNEDHVESSDFRNILMGVKSSDCRVNKFNFFIIPKIK